MRKIINTNKAMRTLKFAGTTGSFRIFLLHKTVMIMTMRIVSLSPLPMNVLYVFIIRTGGIGHLCSKVIIIINKI